MELNLAQLLVHDGKALAKFRRDHNILDDVAIERLGPREGVNTVKGDGNRISVRIWLIHQAVLRFPISLKEVMAECHLTFMQVSYQLC